MFRNESLWYIVAFLVIVLMGVLLALPEIVEFVKGVNFSIRVLNGLTTW